MAEQQRRFIVEEWETSRINRTLFVSKDKNNSSTFSDTAPCSRPVTRCPGLEQEKKLLRTLPPLRHPDLIPIFTRIPYEIRGKNHGPLYVPFNDVTMHTTSSDLLKLSVGLTEKNMSTFLKFNVDVHGRQFEELKLCRNSKKMLSLPNAGGASMLSEVLSYEVMERLLGVDLLKTEMEVHYSLINQPMTDYLVNLRHPHYTNPLTIGVSVTRAYAHDRRYTNDDAHRLLTKKLAGVNSSTKNIDNARIWKQILHIWCPNGQTANVVKRVYMKMSPEYKANTVVMVSIVDSKWVFTNNKVVYPPRKKDLPKKKRKKRV
ncbi:3545_t:CDS:2 [Ambispora gerdemannii]|uniref:3545_t:CDS:1 n=1 Tax=Ambispora gerdemannii TaxID=144530 RepID=A0A9N9CJT1_9GLOM|nr:3545_t:CDS:2 [Ambispora gerdemannii]